VVGWLLTDQGSTVNVNGTTEVSQNNLSSSNNNNEEQKHLGKNRFNVWIRPAMEFVSTASLVMQNVGTNGEDQHRRTMDDSR
jgi:hypothetical protein